MYHDDTSAGFGGQMDRIREEMDKVLSEMRRTDVAYKSTGEALDEIGGKVMRLSEVAMDQQAMLVDNAKSVIKSVQSSAD